MYIHFGYILMGSKFVVREIFHIFVNDLKSATL